MTPEAHAKAMLAAERQKERDSHLSGWGVNTVLVDGVVQADETKARGFGESQELRAWIEKRRMEIHKRDAELYEVAK